MAGHLRDAAGGDRPKEALVSLWSLVELYSEVDTKMLEVEVVRFAEF